MPKVLQVLDDNFGEEPVSEKNLFEWRTSRTGYQRWLDRRDRLHTIKSLTDYSVQLAEEKLELEQKRLRRQTAELFIKYAQNEEAHRVVISRQSQTVKLDRLVQLMFGQAPERGE